MGAFLKLFKAKKNLKNDNKNIEELSNNYKIIKIHICGYGKNKINVIKSLFSKEIKNPNLKAKGDSEYKSNDFYWITKNYEDKILTKEIVRSIQDNIENDRPKINDEEEEEEEEEEEVEKGSKKGKNKKKGKKEKKENKDNEEKIYFHILLLFGDDNDIGMILKEIDEIYRPRIIFVTEKKKECITDNKKYITNIICEGMDEMELNSNIISSLWELDCYYNEKGNEIFRHTPVNILKGFQTDMSFFSINILLTGLSRSGKSSFINLLSEKLVALESNDSDSVTLKVSEYYIYRNDDKREHGAIKLIDTPGICENNQVNSKTLEAIKDYLDNKDNKIEKHIHFILFFFMESTPLGNSDKLLKILNKHDYPVFFIINKSVDRRDKGISSDINSKIN
jgi:GTP-binding protein EngB required for normal cell division